MNDNNTLNDNDDNFDLKDKTYFQYYGLLCHQQNMLQDQVRTSIYQKAIIESPTFFKDKVVMDVGAGSGILSFFSCYAGASFVYAVEASNMCIKLKILVERSNKTKVNGYINNKIKIINKKVEDIKEKDIKVDTIISEPIGIFIFHERMIESFIYARENFLKEGGTILPSESELFIEPISDPNLWNETKGKARFWENTNFYGVDLSGLRKEALDEIFQMPVVGYFDPNILINTSYSPTVFNFETISMDELKNININKSYIISSTTVVHGFGCWFDIIFKSDPSKKIIEGNNEQNAIRISTAPYSDPTHWQQIRLLLKNPLAVNKGQTLNLSINMKVNDFRSYDMFADITIVNTLDKIQISSRKMFWRLNDQSYNYNSTQNNNSQNYPEYYNLYDRDTNIEEFNM